MQKLSKMESFKSFQISKKSMNQIAGSRTKNYIADWDFVDGDLVQTGCVKQIDDNDGVIRRVVFSDRFDGRC